MKIIRFCNQVERYIDPNLLEEFNILKSRYANLSKELVYLFGKGIHDENDINWVNKKEKLINQMKELEAEMSLIKAPAIERMKKSIKEGEEDYRKRKEESEKRLEMAKNNLSFKRKIERAVSNWPRTDNPNLAGYIMQDGEMLQMSYQGTSRDMDHREITGDIEELDGGTNGMNQFQYATGAIRLHKSGKYVSFDWLVKPTRSQQRKMVEIAEKCSEIRINDSGEDKSYEDVYEMQEEYGWY